MNILLRADRLLGCTAVASLIKGEVLLRSLNDFPGGSEGKESAFNAEDQASIPGSGRYPGEGNSYPLQYSGLENSTGSSWGLKESDTTEHAPSAPIPQ